MKKIKLINKENTIEFIHNGVFKKKLHGYVFIKIGTKFVPEHKLIVEDYIKRMLNKDEVIHHINGVKNCNSLNNLMLFPSQKEHASFHNKINQFGLTNPIRLQIKNRWNK
jgi:hypothetical protein